MFHREGYKIIISAFLLVSVLVISLDYFEIKFALIVKVFLIVILVLILQFFRNPKIKINSNENYILSPVDGKVVIIEEVYEPFLIQQGFIMRTPRGREATELAFKHLNKEFKSSQKGLF